jgi:hypothetical protein
MYQYYITEIRKTSTGEFEHENFWVYDEDEQTARLKGEGKFHEVLSRAATSTFAEHGAILFTSTCYPIKHECYTHGAEEVTV